MPRHRFCLNDMHPHGHHAMALPAMPTTVIAASRPIPRSLPEPFLKDKPYAAPHRGVAVGTRFFATASPTESVDSLNLDLVLVMHGSGTVLKHKG
eukprot:1801012-Amphidinium_carterae.1